jgi:hypothetical protein
VLNTAFQVSPTAPSIVSYRASASVTASLAGNHKGRVQFRMGPTAGSTTVQPSCCEVEYNLGLGVAIANKTGNGNAIGGFVPAGWWVMLETVTDAGSPVLTLVSNATLSGAQVEQLLA